MPAQLAAELDGDGGLTTDGTGPTPEQLTLLAALAVNVAKKQGSRPSAVLEQAKSRATRLERMGHRTVRMEAGD